MAVEIPFRRILRVLLALIAIKLGESTTAEHLFKLGGVTIYTSRTREGRDQRPQYCGNHRGDARLGDLRPNVIHQIATGAYRTEHGGIRDG